MNRVNTTRSISSAEHQTPVRSQDLYRRACEIFLGGTQTLSKQPHRFDALHFPAYIDRAQGSRVWDVDGNEYLDYIMALGPIILGYCHPTVDRAVEEQLRRGVLYSGNSPLEISLGEELLQLIPNAERMRFFKTGAEATSAAVRLCRNFTGREKIVSCGYHGWHDWYVAKNAEPGVPAALCALIFDLPYGDSARAQDLFEQHGNEIACLILEPILLKLDMRFLEEVACLARNSGSLIVFDEIITGFRWALGGAQERTGLRADLAVFGKALANGFPLSTVIGRGEIFDAAEGLWISSTFGGEALSLTASLATLGELKQPDTLNRIHRLGEKLLEGWHQLLMEFPEVHAEAFGEGALPVLHFDPSAKAQEDAFVRFLLHRGVAMRRNHYWFITASHTQGDIDRTLDVCWLAFRHITENLSD
jgi:glutamate-1-semialdehyde aminotransferase